MNRLNIDIETFSPEDLSKVGVYKYCDHPEFEILLFGYAVDGGEVHVVDLKSGDKIPKEILEALTDTGVKKWAFNAAFERVCIGRMLGQVLEPKGWRCTMVAASYLGLPGSLASIGSVLNIDKQKYEGGKDLIKLFSVPRKPTKSNSATRIFPEDEPLKWKEFIYYNHRDVMAEMEILERVSKYPVPDKVWEQYELDQQINDRGIYLDMELVNRAIECDEITGAKYLTRAQELTGLDNPNSPLQLKEWLEEQGVEVESLAKVEVAKLMKECSGEALEVLELRQLLSKSSVKKYNTMRLCCCKDNRAHGLLQFYGTRTGRWAGRLIQVQNLYKNKLKNELSYPRELIKNGNYEAVELLYDSVPDILAQLIRTAFIPKPGYKFLVADFSAIECRVLAWIAGERWVLDVFAAGEDIYCKTAEKMYHVPVTKTNENHELRAKGKQATLSCGYGGSVGALIAMGALESGMKEEELKPLVDTWREANPNIVKFWWDVDKAAITCVKEKKPVKLKNLTFVCESGIMFIGLPSGRRIAYVKPRIFKNEYGRDEISYMGVGATKKWERIGVYGPKLVENIVQAISRDILAEAMLRLEAAGYACVMHIHDECVIEATKEASLEEVCRIMSEVPTWAPGLILDAAGYSCDFYMKD